MIIDNQNTHPHWLQLPTAIHVVAVHQIEQEKLPPRRRIRQSGYASEA
jgi:hypothetical protein